MEAIEYKTVIGDVEALALHHLKHSPSVRRNARIGGGFSGFLMFVVLAVSLSEGLGRAALAVALLGGVCGAVGHQWLLRRLTRAHVRRTYSTGKNKGVFGWHRLALLEHELREESDAGSVCTRYEAIESLVETDSHIIVYLNAVMAHIVPKKGVSSGELGPFVESLRGRMARASAATG